jgi:hypothetical protein
MVADVLRTFKIIMTTVGAVFAVEKIERRGCECRLCLMITWVTEQTLNIIFVIADNDGIPNGGRRYDEREVS